MEECVMLESPGIADEFIPETAYELIDRLVEVYPERCILPDQTIEEAHRYAGIVDLVTELAAWKQNELGLKANSTD